MKNSPGFSLIEVIIALLISSALLIGLFQVLFQTNKIDSNTSSTIHAHVRQQRMAAVLYNDLSGLCNGVYMDAEKKKNDPSGAATKTQSIVHAVVSNKQLMELSFITNNPFISYGDPTPRFVRVIYKLFPVAGRDDLFSLHRQQMKDPSFKAYTEEKERDKQSMFLLAKGLKSVKASFYYRDEKHDSKRDKQNNKKHQQPVTYRKIDIWQENAQQHYEKEMQSLPSYVEFTVVQDEYPDKKNTFIVPVLNKKQEQRSCSFPASVLPKQRQPQHAQMYKRPKVQMRIRR